jgi:Ca2+-binding RTX toxin-like protein
VDAIVGTAGNDTIVATSSTLNAADVIIDQNSKDSDKMTIAATGDLTRAATIIGIENIDITFAGFTATGGGGGATDFEIDATNYGASKISVSTSGTTAVTSLSFGDVATGTEITASSQFGTVNVSADDNAAVVVNTNGKTSTTTSAVNVAAAAGALTALTVNESTGNVNVVVNSGDLDGTLTVSSAKNATVDADAATSATVTAGGNITVDDLRAAESVKLTSTGGTVTATAGTGLASATSVQVTATKKVEVSGIDSAAEVTVSAGGVDVPSDPALKSTISGATTLKTVNLSGNGAAAEFDLQGAVGVNKVNVSGTQDVWVRMGLDAIDDLGTNGLTFKNTGSGATQLRLFDAAMSSAVADLTNVDVGTRIVIRENVSDGNSFIRLASGANVYLEAAQTNIQFSGKSATASTNTATFTVDNPASATTTFAIGTIRLTDIKSATIDLSKDVPPAGTTIGVVNAGSTDVTINAGAADLTFTGDVNANKLILLGSGDIDLGDDIEAAEVDATAVTGDVTLETDLSGDDGGVNVVRTGSGDDIITSTAAGDFLVQTGAGNDQVTVFGDLSKSTVSIDMGAGSSDLLVVVGEFDEVDDVANLNSSTVTFAGVERIRVEADKVTFRDTQLSGLVAEYATTAGTALETTITINQAANDFSSLVIDTATIGDNGDTFVINASSRTTTAVSIVGTKSDDIITGSQSAKAFADTLNGGNGNDTLIAGQGGDVLIGGAGIDEARFADLADGNVENSTKTSTGVVVNMGTTAVGSAVISAAMGTSFISSASSTVEGGTYTYLYSSTGRVGAPSTTGTIATVENVVGTDGADYIVGSSANNVLDGGDGNDWISGGAGNDTIIGGAGADTLTGGAGADTFVYLTVGDSTTANSDRITDFSSAAGDRLDVAALVAAYTEIDDVGGAANGQLVIVDVGHDVGALGAVDVNEFRFVTNYDVGTNTTTLEFAYDTNTTAATTTASNTVVILLTGNVNLAASDFLFGLPTE